MPFDFHPQQVTSVPVKKSKLFVDEYKGDGYKVPHEVEDEKIL